MTAVAVAVAVCAGAVASPAMAAPDGTRADVRFRPVLAVVPSDGPPVDAAAVAEALEVCDPDLLLGAIPAGSSVPVTGDARPSADACVVLDQAASASDPDAPRRVFLGPAELDVESIKSARVVKQAPGNWCAQLALTRDGARAMNQMAADLYPQAPPRNEVAITFVDDGEVVQSVPSFQQPTFSGGVCVTTARKADARRIVQAVKSALGD